MPANKSVSSPWRHRSYKTGELISDIQARSLRRAEYRDQREDEDFDPRLTPGLGVEKGSAYRRMTNKALIAAVDDGDKTAQAELDRRAGRRSQKRQDKPRSNPGYSEVPMLRLPRVNGFRRNPESSGEVVRPNSAEDVQSYNEEISSWPVHVRISEKNVSHLRKVPKVLRENDLDGNLDADLTVWWTPSTRRCVVKQHRKLPWTDIGRALEKVPGGFSWDGNAYVGYVDREDLESVRWALSVECQNGEYTMQSLRSDYGFRRNPNNLRVFCSLVDWDSYTQTMGQTTWECSEDHYALLEPYLTELHDGTKHLDWDLIVKQFHLHAIPVVVKVNGQIVRTSTLGKEMRDFV